MDVLVEIRRLNADGWTGVQIAEYLRDAGANVEEAREAFDELCYAVSVDNATDTPVLHVSNIPVSQSVREIEMKNSHQLPSVLWEVFEGCDANECL